MIIHWLLTSLRWSNFEYSLYGHIFGELDCIEISILFHRLSMKWKVSGSFNCTIMDVKAIFIIRLP